MEGNKEPCPPQRWSLGDPAQRVSLLPHPLAEDKHKRQSQQCPQKLRQLADAGSRSKDLTRWQIHNTLWGGSCEPRGFFLETLGKNLA